MTEPDFQPRSRIRLRVALAAIAVLVLLIILVTPPLVNLNRLQSRITVSMSQGLGRPVHIDPPITFHLLPTPGFTVHNLVVSEDPAFGNEPTIRCMNVRAQLRLSSLWRRQVEISRISFEPDDNGVGASLNLVRLADGRNNLEALLAHASHIDAAPTAQTKAGPAPRFPYIEARAARVNFKQGDEKLPFSLTDAEFALWLPNPHEWRFQLKSHPARTDTDTADTGTIRAEGSIKGAPSIAEAPIDITASWHDAPLGEASTLVRGADAGWRGTLNADVAATGTLNAATLQSHLTLNDLRRADFVPAHPLDLSIPCTANGDLDGAQIEHAHCELITGDGSAGWIADSNGVDLHTLHAASTTVHGNVPLAALFAWFKVLSPRTPQDEDPAGTVTADFTRSAKEPWRGEATATIPTAPALTLAFTAADGLNGPCTTGLTLSSTPVALDKTHTVNFAGAITRCGYSYRMTGTAAPQSLLDLGAMLPTLAEGVSDKLPKSAGPIDLTCTRSWFQPQVCTANTAEPARKPSRRHR